MSSPKPKRPKLTLMEAQSSRTADLVDRLIDAPNTTAASVIRQLPREQLDLALLHAVSSVDERWRVRDKPEPLPLTEALTAVLFAAGDALDAINRTTTPQEEK